MALNGKRQFSLVLHFLIGCGQMVETPNLGCLGSETSGTFGVSSFLSNGYTTNTVNTAATPFSTRQNKFGWILDIKVCQSGVILAHEMTRESSYAAVYLRCALPRLRTAMRLLVWVDDETKGAASVRDRLHTLKRALALARWSVQVSQALRAFHPNRVWPFTCHICACACTSFFHESSRSVAFAKSQAGTNGSEIA